MSLPRYLFLRPDPFERPHAEDLPPFPPLPPVPGPVDHEALNAKIEASLEAISPEHTQMAKMRAARKAKRALKAEVKL